MGTDKKKGKGSRSQHKPSRKRCDTTSPNLVAFIENDLLLVREVESLDALDLDALPLLVPAHGGLTLSTLLAIEYGHDLDEMDLENLPNRLQNKEV